VKFFNKFYISNKKRSCIIYNSRRKISTKKISDLFSRSANNKQDYLRIIDAWINKAIRVAPNLIGKKKDSARIILDGHG